MAATAVEEAPTHAVGYVDNTSWWSRILADWSETIGDVMWPTSVWTYSQMRRDPRLQAILSAYTLPIRRASWAVDPAGCRDEVAQLVADDLGLPILGGDQPAAARVQGVSWAQHLRMALLDLTYGHMGFEMEADVSSGQARLVGLYERMPASISQIHVERQGQFGGISQWSLPGAPNLPDIPADHMVWYAHEREGGQWQGHSLLRSSYAPWLLKREMQRVHATGNRRFSMGIPVVRWLPGSTPTPAQHAAAQQIAQNMRTGDQAGAALPPGAIIELVGLSGSVPDTLGFLNWLNGEMSTATLTHFLDLVTSTHGSRALGQAFIDYFLLAIQAVAEETADTTTRMAAARLVEWNWGADEPVPKVTVADVGSRHEVTAEAIASLMSYGAIQPDPALEAYIRGEYGLPQRTTPQPGPAQPPVPPTPPQPPADPGTDPAADPAYAAARDRTAQILAYVNGRPGGVRAGEVERQFGTDSRKALARLATAGRLQRAGRGLYVPMAADGTTGQSGLSRDLTDVETASGVDFAAYQADWQTAQQQLLDQWPDLAAPIRDELVAAVVTAVAAGNLAALGTLTASSAALAAALAAAMTAAAATAAAGVVAEAASQGVTFVAPTAAGADSIPDVAGAIAGILVNGLASAAGRKALQAAGPDTAAADVGQAVATTLDEMATAPAGWVADNLGQAVTVGQATGRTAALAAAPDATYYASEVMDRNTCAPCYDVDGKQFVSLALAEAEYARGGYAGCLGGLRCRGIIIARWES